MQILFLMIKDASFIQILDEVRANTMPQEAHFLHPPVQYEN